jgi:cyanophycinase
LITLGSDFLAIAPFANVVTDTHFRERDRMGRLVVFVTRIQQDILSRTVCVRCATCWLVLCTCGAEQLPLGNWQARGIACDEATGLLVDADGNASVTSKRTTGSCYLLQASQMASTCQPGVPLSIDALNVVRLSGNITNAFDLQSWHATSSKVASYSLSVRNGVLASSGNGGLIY